MNRPSVFTTLVGIAMACGFAIALVFQATAGQIERNRLALLEQAVGQVLPGTATMRGYAIDAGSVAVVGTDQADFIAGYSEGGALLGAAVPAGVMGYQDSIRMLFGYDPATETLTGFVVLESRETPGLGSKIGTDPAFLATLIGLDVRLVGSALANEITLTMPGARPEAWQVDGITGATVSSRAVVRAVNASAATLAVIHEAVPVLEAASPGEVTPGESVDA